jgi:hypothetical protein
MSKSGIDTRSGLRKRSNRRPKRIGSRSVMVSAYATSEPAPGPDRDSLLLGPLDEVGHDQEVARILHLLDHAELEIEPVAVVVDGAAGREAEGLDAALEPFGGLAAQLGRFIDRGPIGRGEARQNRVALLRPVGAALRDLDGRGERLGHVREQRRHLGARLEIVLGRELAPLGFGDHAAFRDADQRIMRLEVLAPPVIGLVGGDDREGVAVGDVDQAGLDLPLLGERMALQLDIEPVAEQGGKPHRPRRRQLHLPARECDVERSGRPAGEHDQPLLRGLEHGELDVRRLARGRVEERARGQPHQVAVALLARGEQHQPWQPEGVAGVARRLLVAEVDRERAADDRLDAAAGELVGELQRAEHVVGVGQRERRLAVGLGELRQLGDRQGAFQQRIGRVHMQMHEAGVRHASSL